jgi:hypothetical protein
MLTFETLKPGLQVGMKATTGAYLSKIGVGSMDLFITSIQATSQKGVALTDGSCFIWTVTAYNTMDPGNDLKYWERVIQRGELPAPASQQVVPTLILFPGSSLAGGAVAAPVIVAQTCQVLEIAVACEDGPVDCDVYIDLIDSASGTILSTPLKIPDGTAAAAVLTFTQLVTPGGTWLFQNETIKASVIVQQTGPNPQTPTGVNIQIRGQF